VDLSERTVVEVQVIESELAQLPGAQSNFGRRPGHRVGAGRISPLADASELLTPALKEAGELDRRRRHTDGEVAAVERSVDFVDGRGDDPACELEQLALVTKLQEAKEEVDPLGFAAPGRRGE